MRGGVKYTTVTQYINGQSAAIRPTLKKMRQVIKKSAPDAEEVISYGMPGYKYYGMLAFFAVFKNHYSFFFRPRVLSAFKNELRSYKTSKSGLLIPLDKPVPVKLVSRIVKVGAKLNYEIAKEKGKIKKNNR